MAWVLVGICAISLFLTAEKAQAQDDIVITPEDVFSLRDNNEQISRVDFLENLTAVPSSDTMGQVRIFQDERIRGLIGIPGKTTPENIEIVDGHRCVIMTGYRVQAYAGNNQATAKQEAFQREIHLKAYMPGLTTYVRYSAPFWRLRVGDYMTYEEAYEVLLKFQKAFEYGREMSIVREKINVLID